MAQQQLLRTKLVQVPFPALDCPRYCWDALRASTSRNTTLFTQASQRRRTQTRGLSSCRTTSSSSTFHPQPRRHPAAPALLHPRSAIWNGRSSVKTTGLLAMPAITQASSSAYSSFFSTSGISRAEAPASTPQAARPEPPDYLDEKERAIFDRLNEALSPIELQVCGLLSRLSHMLLFAPPSPHICPTNPSYSTRACMHMYCTARHLLPLPWRAVIRTLDHDEHKD